MGLQVAWRDANPSGAASIEWYDRFAETGDRALLQRILDYNEDDYLHVAYCVTRPADNDTMPMHPYSIQNPVFLVYMIAAAIMVLKLMGQGLMTVYRMIKSDSGLLNPEDLTPGPANRNPHPQQLQLNEYVDRSRRIHRNDLENIPAFLAAGLLFVAVRPSLLLASVLMGAFVVARLLHTVAYLSKQRHEIRALLFTIGALVVIYMAIHVLIVALSLL